MKELVKSVVVLLVICLVVSVALAAVNFITEPIILESANQAANKALLVVMPEGKNFSEITDLSQYKLPASVTNVYREDGGGYVFRLSVTGYSAGMILMCGVNSSGEITGAVCVSSSETLGAEKVYGDYFKGATLDTVGGVDSVSGSTARLTMNAYKAAMKDSLGAAAILGGGDADLRTDEEKLADNLRKALPGGENFTKWFKVEKLDPAVTAVYVSDNDKGLVIQIGELFIGFDNEGATQENSATEEQLSVAEKAFMAVFSSEITELDISGFNFPRVTSAYKTSSGNYRFHLKAPGFGITGTDVEYAHPSGEYIEIDIAISSDGNILDIVTTYQNESKGIGDVCADPSYYGKFVGQSADTYSGVDVGSGATYTANGYKKAIGDAFGLYNQLKGAE